MHDAVGLQQLIAEYGKLDRLEAHTPQSRGRRFNEVIAAVLQCWGIEAQVSVRSAGEIDVAFTVDGVRYLLEAKWEQTKADTGDVAKLQRRVRQRFAGTVGVFIAMAGYSPDALAEVRQGERLEVLLFDRQHFEAVLSGFVPPRELLKMVHDRAAFRGEAYTPLLTLLATLGSPPAALFNQTGELDAGLVQSARNGVSGTLVCVLPDSNQLGITIRDRGGLLVTTQDGIIEVELGRKRSSWAVPIPDCHRNPVLQADGSVLFLRRHGVGQYQSGKLTIVSGGFVGATSLVKQPDGTMWVLSNGDLSGDPGASITRLGIGLGQEVRHPLTYPPRSATNAIWVDESNLVTIGNSGFLITNLASGATRKVDSATSNPMGSVHLGNNVLLTVGDSVALGLTDLATGKYAEVMRLALRPSVYDITAAPDNHFYLAAYYGNGQQMRIAVVDIAIAPPIEDQIAAAMRDASRGDLSIYSADIECLRSTTAQVKEETGHERLGRLYNDAFARVTSGLFLPLRAAIESTGLRLGDFSEQPLDGWPPAEYGGAANLPRWGIETLTSPWLAASIGVVHRAQPAEDLKDLAVTFVLARLAPHHQHTHINRFERFKPGAPELTEIIDRLRREIENQLPSIIESFIEECRTAGVPR